jgi:hypothetical protein
MVKSYSSIFEPCNSQGKARPKDSDCAAFIFGNLLTCVNMPVQELSLLIIGILDGNINDLTKEEKAYFKEYLLL